MHFVWPGIMGGAVIAALFIVCVAQTGIAKKAVALVWGVAAIGLHLAPSASELFHSSASNPGEAGQLQTIVPLVLQVGLIIWGFYELAQYTGSGGNTEKATGLDAFGGAPPGGRGPDWLR